jgi:hypothetical protein
MREPWFAPEALLHAVVSSLQAIWVPVPQLPFRR